MYQQIDHDVAPKLKIKKEWMLKAAKAIAKDFMGQGHKMFAKNNGHYDLMRLYGMGKQPIDQYKKLREVDEADDTSIMNVDWTPRGPGIKYRDIAIEKVLEIYYSPVATPIDLQSKDEGNSLYARMKAKIMQRNMILQQHPEMANHPQLQLQPGDPQDLEELEMMVENGEQFVRAKNNEQLVSLAFWENRVPEAIRPQWVKDLWDCGVAAYKDDLDADGRPFVRLVDLSNFGCSSCKKSDFSDMKYGFEIVEMPHNDMKHFFSLEEFEEIKNINIYGSNPFGDIGFLYPQNRTYITGEPGCSLVMDFELYSWDTLHWEVGESKYGNLQVKRTGPGKNSKVNKTIKYVYRGKWIVGTDYIFEYGIKPNIKRRYADLRRASNTTLSYKAIAYNFNKMICGSYMERLKPLIDDYMMIMLAAQNIRNNLVPNGYAFDLDALENVALSQGGEPMAVKEILNMFYKRGIIVYRGKDLSGNNPNAKAIDISQNSISGEISSLYNELMGVVQQMRDVTGLNEITDGSTPSDRMLNGVAGLANTATNTALKPIIRADRQLLTELGNDLFIRAQQAVRKGSYSGYFPSLNETTMKFVEADATESQKDCAIMLEMRVTDDQRQMIMQYMQESFAQGLLDPTDIITLLNTYNLKQAQAIWSHRIKKNKEIKRQQEIENQQMTFKGQQESSVVAEEAKQKTINIEYEWKMKIEQEITRRMLNVTKMKLNQAVEDEMEEEEAINEEEDSELFMNENK